MLILPLHRPITRATFPLVTAFIVLLNVFVFFVLQGGDSKAEAAATEYYQSSGLSEIEAPLYSRHLQQHPDSRLQAVLAEVGEEMRPLVLDHWQQNDQAFRSRLQRGELFEDTQSQAAWQSLESQFLRLKQRVFTERHALQADQPGPADLLSSMFLHGGLDHLFGNMLFLIALGLLVEGPLGGWTFAGLYLLGGLGAGLAWSTLNSHGSLIGASGAVAALMGAFCVLWGRRRVRFFYWFFVVFNYVKGPALALLPVWLGWELLQYLWSDGSRVAYEAHAGGIVSGALLALVVRKLGWQREAYFQGDETDAAAAVDDLPAALALLGQLRLPEAEAKLNALEQADPGRLDVAVASYRCARFGKKSALAQRWAERAIERQAKDAEQVRQQWSVYQDLIKADGGLPAALHWALASRLLGIGEADEALSLALATLDAKPPPTDPAQAALSLSFRFHEAGFAAQAKRLLSALRERFPDSVQAGKAEFLLKEW